MQTVSNEKNDCLTQNDGPLKAIFLQCYEVIWIYSYGLHCIPFSYSEQ